MNTPVAQTMNQVSQQTYELAAVLGENEKLAAEIETLFGSVLRQPVPEVPSADKSVEREQLVPLADNIRDYVDMAKRIRRTLQGIIERREV
jgi:hypothetical protein